MITTVSKEEQPRRIKIVFTMKVFFFRQINASCPPLKNCQTGTTITISGSVLSLPKWTTLRKLRPKFGVKKQRPTITKSGKHLKSTSDLHFKL